MMAESDGTRAKVLVADDSQTSLAVVRGLLEGDGYQVVTARDGLEAVEMAFRENPDVVLLDVVMPRMNGYQVCRMLKLCEQTHHMPVVMLTSRDQPADEYWGFQTGADGYVTKEQPPRVVLDVVAQMLGQRAGRGVLGAERSDGQAASLVDLLTRLNDVLDRKLYEATILGEMSRLAWSATDVERTAQGIMSLLGQLFDFHLASELVGAGRSGAAELLWMVRSPINGDALASCEENLLAAYAEKSGTVLDAGAIRRRIVVASGASLEGPGGSYAAPRLRPCCAVPLGSKDHKAGLFALWVRGPMVPSQESIHIVGMLANAASVVLDNARLYQEMQRLATTDGLTGLANYRQFRSVLDREFQRSLRTGESMAMVMMDLDNFKWVNDTFGHKSGDQVLQSVATAFARSVRPYDVVARYGGEEFAVILPSIDASSAVIMAERLRLLVHGVAARMRMDRLSVSAGVALYPGPGVADAQALVREADAALYRAKAEGKDRVQLAPRE